MKITDIELNPAPLPLPLAERILFTISTESILLALDSRCAYHRSRLDHWQAEEAKAAEELKATTRIEEQPITGGMQRMAVIDQEISKRLTVSQNKVTEHRNALWKMRSWRHGFGTLGKTTVGLYEADLRTLGLVTDPAEEATNG